MNGCAPGLALIERLKATQKWAIGSSLEILRVYEVPNVEIFKGKYEAYKIAEVFRVVPQSPFLGRGVRIICHDDTILLLRHYYRGS